MTNSIFKQTIFISILGHITLFSIFNFSFGPKIPEAHLADVSFWGAILPNSLINERDSSKEDKTRALIRKPDMLLHKKIARESLNAPYNYSKPQISLTSNNEKIDFTQKLTPESFVSKRTEPTIIFYPKLPYNFALYFKDREVAHIELMFGIISDGRRNSISIKRKVSSGNLEVDLLTTRYIGRYLFIQQMVFAPNNWQTVKIDLSAKEP